MTMQPQENPTRFLMCLHGNSTEGFLLKNLYCLEYIMCTDDHVHIIMILQNSTSIFILNYYNHYFIENSIFIRLQVCIQNVGCIFFVEA